MQTPKRLRVGDHLCSKCGSPYRPNIHHQIPRMCGGSNHPSNLITLCHACHVAHHKAQQHYRDGGAIGGTQTMSKPTSKARALANLRQFAGWQLEDLEKYVISRALCSA